MVSPSKIQHQEHKQPPRENLFEKHSHVRIQKGSKPLEKKSFYLDIKNHATAAKIEARIKDLGGVTELFLVRSVSLVVSDRVDQAGYVNSERRKWGCVSGGSGGIPSLRSLETPTPMQTPPIPFFSSECPLSNSTNLRGQTAQRSKSRVDAMLERALIQPQQCSVDPLDNAQSWGIPIWAIDKLQAWLDKIYASFKDVDYLKRIKHSSQQTSGKDLKVRHFKGPYIKFESFQRNTRPVFLELPAWPTLNFHGDPGSCPFNTKRREKVDKSVRKEVKENREDIRFINKEEDKEMTRRPRTTVTRTRRTEQLASGYCEICRVGYRDLSKHVQTDQHLNFVRNDDNFLSLDTLINAGANVEAFLKLNRTKDIEKDCNLFPNGDHRDLREVVLPDEKVSNSAKGLEEFGVEDIKMVQCNGARRNLNLKLSSPHNLRTRAKHESGHLLRSKGSPWHEVDKSDKFYDKFEGFTIKKRAKGTIWIEEDEAGDDFAQNPELKGSKEGEYKIKQFSKNIEEICNEDSGDNVVCNKHSDSISHDVQKPVIRSSGQNGISNVDSVKQHQGSVNHRNHEQINGSIINGCTENTLFLNDNSRVQSCKVSRDDAFKELNGDVQPEKVPLSTKKPSEDCDRVHADVICNGHAVKEELAVQINKAQQVEEKSEAKDERLRGPRSSRRGGRSIRGRHRLSVEERLIEDNRAYYKVEVLGSKLRSSVLPNNSFHNPASKDAEGEEEKKEVPSSEKPVVVRFKRVRKSELSLLSDEAESFMFGEPKRDDSSEISDGDQSSVLPKDTESEWNDSANSFCPSSPVMTDSSMKTEIIEEDSQDSLSLGRARKRRRTQAEALIMDNTDYYKFETPGSRLRYQAPLTGIKESVAGQDPLKLAEVEGTVREDVVEKVYPSKPSAEVEKMQFSFEAVPMSESWYQTYQRQDEGAEFWHYFSEGDTRKPFLLPYEIDNFHEILIKNQSKIESRRRGRGRSIGCIGRSPRKSPRCHASTLAIMSTIIRKKEQQQTSNLYTIEECQPVRPQSQTPRPDQTPKLEPKSEPKSDVDEKLREMVKTIDEMLNAAGNAELNDSFEPDPMQVGGNVYEPTVPKGPPQNLVELLENCHEIANCLENSSCASSECGEGNTESPLKRRKKRKNRTGWPGIKMKKKLQSKPSVDAEGERENLSEKDAHEDEERLNVQSVDVPNRLLEETSDRITQSNNGSRDDGEQLSFSQWKDEGRLHESCSSNAAPNVYHDGTGKRDSSTEINDGVSLHSIKQESVDLSVPELCSGSERTFVLSKDYEFRKNLSEIEEISENDPGNDENHENVFRKDVNSISITERRFISKPVIKKRQRENTSTDTCEPHTELENHDILCRKDAESRIAQRKHHNSNGLPRKRQQRGHSVNPDTEIVRNSSVYRRNRVASRKRIYSRKRTKKNNISSDTVFEVENCKKDSYLSITCGKQQQQLKGVKRRADAISSETQDSELECALAERVSPTIMPSSEREQRQSSIDFQPVVRMMKIDDQVDMDHSILSVTVASNRRLRSSSSPRSNTQPPKKRLKTSRGQFSRWLKSS